MKRIGYDSPAPHPYDPGLRYRDVLAGEGPNPEEAYAALEERARLREALRALSVVEVYVIWRRYRHGRTCEQIARALGVRGAVRAVEAIERRALARLRELIEGRS